MLFEEAGEFGPALWLNVDLAADIAHFSHELPGRFVTKEPRQGVVGLQEGAVRRGLEDTERRILEDLAVLVLSALHRGRRRPGNAGSGGRAGGSIPIDEGRP